MHNALEVCDTSPTVVIWFWSPTLPTLPPLFPILFLTHTNSCYSSWLSKLSPDTVMRPPFCISNPFLEACKQYIWAAQDTMFSQTLKVDLFWWPLLDGDKNEWLCLVAHMISMAIASSKSQLCSPSPSWLGRHSTWWTPEPVAHAYISK